ncbi:hypothetical protein DLJ53_02960 [Acuticoccus sediminis]|uniref:HTH crp-type domain-containing protein n=1 Tax=Acuticoccus sediminis TaxID=2184697 RepID=A0A8B2NXR4_9HYPH|nr:ROK family transcriptional regulator [Acuticoccus sediminis]RAI03480.1 hypothetical protein DLJ53_02960 [Acuticoccus sediminis]
MRAMSPTTTVLQVLFTQGPLSRSQIAAATGLNPATVTRLTQALIDEGMVEEGRTRVEARQPGRRAIELHLRTDRTFVAGLVVNAYAQTVAIADIVGRTVAECDVPRLAGASARETLMALAAAAVDLAAANAVPRERIVGTGVLAAGLVTQDPNVVLKSPDIGWFDVAVDDPVRAVLDVPVVLETMQNGLNLAECAYGRAAGTAHAMLVSVALGIGSSLIVDDRLIRGAGQAASGFGHMPVAGAERPCNCGRRGCLTTLAAGYAVLCSLGLVEPYRTARDHDPAYAPLLADVLARAETGDPDASEALGAAGEALGEALKAASAVAAPEVIILSGPVPRAASYREGVERGLAPSPRDPFGWGGRLLVSDTPLASAAARLALERFVYGRIPELPPAASRHLPRSVPGDRSASGPRRPPRPLREGPSL